MVETSSRCGSRWAALEAGQAEALDLTASALSCNGPQGPRPPRGGRAQLSLLERLADLELATIATRRAHRTFD